MSLLNNSNNKKKGTKAVSTLNPRCKALRTQIQQKAKTNTKGAFQEILNLQEDRSAGS